MGVRRAQHHAVGLAQKVDVVLEAALAAQEAPVLKAPHRLPDSELAHRSVSVPDVVPGLSAYGKTELSLRGAQRRSNLDRQAHCWHEIASLRSQ
jgi:hypothetical protein